MIPKKLLRTLLPCSLFIFLFLCSPSCKPYPPAYPFLPADSIAREAQKLSDSLEAYIRLWYAGKASENLPEKLLPKGYDTSRYHHFKLVRYENLKPEQVWIWRPAHAVDHQKQHGSFPDPHCTYLLMPVMYAPFKSKLVIEGEFPYCRFFSIQATPSFDAHEYRYDKYAGKGEVAIVDADITPLAGHSNPFLPGAKRNVTKRSYRVEYEMAIGNPAALNQSHKPPYYRGKQKRYASGIQFQGPWGASKKGGGHGRGVWDFGDVWVRYYGIDKNKGSDAGISFPKAWMELPTGEKFFIVADLQGLIKASETTAANRKTKSNDPPPYNSYERGWDKAFGVYLSISTGLSVALYKEAVKDKAYIRKLDLGVTGRGENQSPPANFEANATCSNYTSYLGRGMAIREGNVFILTGKLPTFPDTRNGCDTMPVAQCRYWSITTYDVDFPFAKIVGMENTSLMDDEVVIDKDRNFIIVYSRPEDRPKNATKENGVTWVDYGQTSRQSVSLRWISVGPEWSFAKAPNEQNLPWSKAAWSGSQFDPGLIGTNNHNGFLGDYLPVAHYLTKAEFEKLGNSFKEKDIPEWIKK